MLAELIKGKEVGEKVVLYPLTHLYSAVPTKSYDKLLSGFIDPRAKKNKKGLQHNLLMNVRLWPQKISILRHLK